MSAADSGTTAPGAENAPPEAPPPAAMSLQEARQLLAERHGAVVDDDDPVLMLVSLHESFVADLDRLLARHAAATAQVMSETGRVTAAAVGDALAVLREEALEGALRNTLARIAEETRQSEGLLAAFRAAGRRLVLVLGLLAALSAVSAGAAIFILVRL